MITTEAFFETGSEGVHYFLFDDSKLGYDRLIKLNDGDQITIYTEEDEIAFCGLIKKDFDTNRTIYPYYQDILNKGFDVLKAHFLTLSGCHIDQPMTENQLMYCEEMATMSNRDLKQYLIDYHSQQLAGGMWVHWLQTGVDPDFWHKLFISELRTDYIPA